MNSCHHKPRFRHGISSIISVIAILLTSAEASYGVTAPTPRRPIDFQYNPAAFRSDLNLPMAIHDRTVSLPINQIEQRLDGYADDSRIEPVQLTVDSQDEKIIELSKMISQPLHQLELANYLKNNFVHGEEIPGTALRLVSIDKDAMKLIDMKAFTKIFDKTHHDIAIPTKGLRRNVSQREQLISQLSPFFPQKEIVGIRGKIMAGRPLSVDKDLLPSFARKTVAGYSIFRGPNCFHAALSFQSPLLASSEYVNVRQEQGYHRNMINYDELWRALQLSFYEVDPTKTQLQYGDMIVLFETKDATNGQVDFKTLRHAATYLMGGYVFAKGSKSANTPYLVRTLGEEWETWTKYTVKLGAKVYRRSLKHVTNPILGDPQDWVY
jgi:hypothetical protein